MQMSTNILKFMAIKSVVQALGWLHSGIFKILKNPFPLLYISEDN